MRAKIPYNRQESNYGAFVRKTCSQSLAIGAPRRRAPDATEGVERPVTFRSDREQEFGGGNPRHVEELSRRFPIPLSGTLRRYLLGHKGYNGRVERCHFCSSSVARRPVTIYWPITQFDQYKQRWQPAGTTGNCEGVASMDARVVKNSLVTRFIGSFSQQNLSDPGTFSTLSRMRYALLRSPKVEARVYNVHQSRGDQTSRLEEQSVSNPKIACQMLSFNLVRKDFPHATDITRPVS